MNNNYPSIETLRQRLMYDALTGALYWKEPSRHSGKRAGSVKHGRYWSVRVDSKHIYNHVAAWALHYGEWPRGLIDHVDGDPSNNKISNLRVATKAQNGWNRGAPRSNKSGYKGIFKGRGGTWRAEVMCNGKSHYVGEFRSLEDAREARARKVAELHGEFGRLA